MNYTDLISIGHTTDITAVNDLIISVQWDVGLYYCRMTDAWNTYTQVHCNLSNPLFCAGKTPDFWVSFYQNIGAGAFHTVSEIYFEAETGTTYTFNNFCELPYNEVITTAGWGGTGRNCSIAEYFDASRVYIGSDVGSWEFDELRTFQVPMTVFDYPDESGNLTAEVFMLDGLYISYCFSDLIITK